MRALIVGAGSVGTVLAYYLRRGGHQARFYLRRPPTPAGGPRLLYDLRRRDTWRRPLSLTPDEPVVDGDSPPPEGWDAVFLCVPSDALDTKLLTRLAPHLAQATVVKLQPGLGDRARITRHVPEDQLVSGMVGFVGYSAPLDPEPRVSAGTAFWIPPRASIPFAGTPRRTSLVVAALRQGGFPARARRDVEVLQGFLLAHQSPLTAGLVCAGGSLSEYAESDWYRISLQAAAEASAVVRHHLGRRPPSWLPLLRHGPLLRLALRLSRKVLPFPLEPFLAAHYGKLPAQSRLHLQDYLDRGASLNVPTASLGRLAEALSATTSSSASAMPMEFPNRARRPASGT